MHNIKMIEYSFITRLIVFFIPKNVGTSELAKFKYHRESKLKVLTKTLDPPLNTKVLLSVSINKR